MCVYMKMFIIVIVFLFIRFDYFEVVDICLCYFFEYIQEKFIDLVKWC